ncbi:hypothetical protein EDB81DRAFT_47540 [Dactylonectria macrodidyma]|uniref:Uncharacterized protein n=1 Tax=Dactylonectria macrodidyma TaxID=307937 RepID=A0A9P9FT77_9HYPO|nr:hypothetical protein EDB81DRAFT_47540 [Dactylonectria macrodidyma]
MKFSSFYMFSNIMVFFPIVQDVLAIVKHLTSLLPNILALRLSSPFYLFSYKSPLSSSRRPSSGFSSCHLSLSHIFSQPSPLSLLPSSSAFHRPLLSIVLCFPSSSAFHRPLLSIVLCFPSSSAFHRPLLSIVLCFPSSSAFHRPLLSIVLCFPSSSAFHRPLLSIVLCFPSSSAFHRPLLSIVLCSHFTAAFDSSESHFHQRSFPPAFVSINLCFHQPLFPLAFENTARRGRERHVPKGDALLIKVFDMVRTAPSLDAMLNSILPMPKI